MQNRNDLISKKMPGLHLVFPGEWTTFTDKITCTAILPAIISFWMQICYFGVCFFTVHSIGKDEDRQLH
ncbi:hypothetical protein Pelo_9449 [Pelomyxa schiedti]|nr:hypothetical protein Pelo_9449 [Pelomyxa schiedti]